MSSISCDFRTRYSIFATESISLEHGITTIVVKLKHWLALCNIWGRNICANGAITLTSSWLS